MAREILTRARRGARKSINYRKIILLIAALIIVFAVFTFFFTKNTRKVKSNENNLATATLTVSASVTNTQELSWIKGRQIDPKILMYHHVGPLPSDADEIRKGLTVSPENFETQLKYLKDNDFQILTLNELYLKVAEGKDVAKDAVLTFDDGYDDNFDYALPLLKKYGAKGTFFIISGSVGKSEYMNSEQIKSLIASGNEIGSHSVTHPSLEKASEKKLTEELIKSKEDLEKIINRQVVSFCYPSGKYSEEVIAKLKKSGYKIAVTTQKGQMFSTDNPYEVPRYRINPNTNLANFF